MRISIFGSGYVGLVTGVCFAEMGREVICADIDESKIQLLQNGVSPIYEPGLEALIASNLKDGRLLFTTDIESAIKSSEVLFIAVGTPSDIDGSADLQYVLKVAEAIGTSMNGYKVIVTKSTVPVGTSTRVRSIIEKTLATRKAAFDFDIIANPEFLKEGSAIEDCLKPSRVIIGYDNERAKNVMTSLYEPFVKNGNPIVSMDLASAELTKYAANAMLATKISFMNELSRICEHTGADIERVRHGIGADPRIGHHFIYPGVGYGGSCFPKDVRALIKMGEDLNDELHILKAVELTNQMQREHFFLKLQRHFGSLQNKTIALWGLAFKPGTDDIRDAPSIDLIEKLLAAGATVVAFDPVATKNVIARFGERKNLKFVENQYQAAQGADALCVVTEWMQFREPDFKKLKKILLNPTIFDGRNIYSPQELHNQGFTLYAIGRATSHASTNTPTLKQPKRS